MNKRLIVLIVLVVALVAIFSGKSIIPFAIPFLFAHCDTTKGPVIQTAKKALESGNVNPVLIWVQKKDEAEIKKAFDKILAVRKLSQEAKEMADMYFFETLVRIHRAGEGEPYTGIKDEEIEPIVAKADEALEKGSIDELANKLSWHLTEKIKEKFNKAVEKKKDMNKSVDAGREYVEAYVEYVHFIESIHGTIMGKTGHHNEEGEDKEE